MWEFLSINYKTTKTKCCYMIKYDINFYVNRKVVIAFVAFGKANSKLK